MKPTVYLLLGCLFCVFAACRMKETTPDPPAHVSPAEKPGNNASSSQSPSGTEIFSISDTIPLPPVDSTLTAQEIRDSLQRFSSIPFTELSPEKQRLRENMVAMWNTDDTVYIQVIVGNEAYYQAFRKQVFHSPRISISQPTPPPPPGILLEDTTLFAMRVEPNVYPPAVEQIEISITNHGKEKGMAGSDYHLEYHNGTEWVNVPQNYAFTALGYPVAPGKTRDGFTAWLYPQLSPNPPGRYRVYKTISTGRGNQLKNYVLVAPFFISDRPEEYAAYTAFASRLHTPRPTAEFKGGEKTLKHFFRTHLHYPEKYKGTGTTVRVFCSFTIDPSGRMKNPECRPENILYPRDTSDTYDAFREEALRVLRQMPAWEPSVDRIHGPQSFSTGLFFIFEEGNPRLE